jgi:hypothetical protein
MDEAAGARMSCSSLTVLRPSEPGTGASMLDTLELNLIKHLH